MDNRKHRIARLVVLYILTLSFLMVTNPAKLPSVVLILPLLLLFCAIYFTVIEIVMITRGKEQHADTPTRRPRSIAAIIAGLPVLLLILQSIGQLTFWDVLTVLAIFIIAYVYALRSSLSLPRR
jgi:hypothetical protein